MGLPSVTDLFACQRFGRDQCGHSIALKSTLQKRNAISVSKGYQRRGNLDSKSISGLCQRRAKLGRGIGQGPIRQAHGLRVNAAADRDQVR